MAEKTAVGVHWSFWAIGIAALIWNSMGVMNFIMQMNVDSLGALPESQRTMIEARPAWASGAFAVAVFGGALGCVLLLLRKSVAYYLFVGSLLGMIVKMSPYIGKLSSTIGLGPFEVTMFILLPLGVAGFLIWYSKQAERKGWIS